jgi:pimeloyl-ACP methyl ester carboxylesterase
MIGTRVLISIASGAACLTLLATLLSAQEPSSRPELVANPSGKGVNLARSEESFSSLSLKDSNLHAQPPIVGGKAETKTFVRELFQVQWRPNDPIDLYVIRPRGAKKPPVVLYLYGFPSDTDRFKDDRYCERVTRGGAAAVGFVSAFTGQRSEHRSPKEWFVSELPEALATTVHDVQMILNYLDSRGDLDMSRVGILGQGSGGAIAILAAAADPRLKALDLLDPWGDWPDWLASAPIVPREEQRSYLKPDFLKRLEPLEPVHFLPELKTRSLRIQFVDEYGESKEAVHKIEAATPHAATVRHYTTALELRNATADGGLFTWISRELIPQKETDQEAKTGSK